MTLKLKVGKKGYIIIPKALRRVYGIKEGDHVVVEARDENAVKFIWYSHSRKI